MSKIAAEDQRFLRYDAQRVTRTQTMPVLSHTLDVTTLVLDRLQAYSGNHFGDGKISTSDYCSHEKFVANLEHILRCLQQALIEALIHDAWRLIERDILHWHQYHWQQRRQSREGWFAEWPNGQRPLNTTWPWNVKPSLVVLWGVCWMFYGFNDDDNNSWMTHMPGRPDLPDENPLSEGLFWAGPSQPWQFLPDEALIAQTSTNPGQNQAHPQAHPQPQRKPLRQNREVAKSRGGNRKGWKDLSADS